MTDDDPRPLSELCRPLSARVMPRVTAVDDRWGDATEAQRTAWMRQMTQRRGPRREQEQL